ncbi:MAG: ferrous iron transporter B, partial [Dehalococcoidia bacterium]|nr:ferrous iron transporter B [Dehalococcoidia bacterium]
GLTAYSPDELIARNFIVKEKPDAVIDIVDASNLERNLYLTVQLLEMGARLIVALNMMDEADSREYRIDIGGLSYLLGVPVVSMVASRNQGTEELLRKTIDVAEDVTQVHGIALEYGREVEEEIANLERLISQEGELCKTYPPRWLAVKLLERDEEIGKEIQGGRK